MRKCIILNNLVLTSKKLCILNNFINEYIRILDIYLMQLPLAISSNELHHLTYSDIRRTSFLPSDVIQEARKDTWKVRKHIISKSYNGTFRFKNCSIRLNKRWFRFVKNKRGNPCFKITYSPRKTFIIPIKTDRQFQRFNSFLDCWSFDNISLLKDGRISVVFEKDFIKPKFEYHHVIGIDIGSSTLASVTVFDIKDSKVIKQIYFGRDIAIKQKRFTERRAKLQSLADKGYKRALKSLERLRLKQFNFVKTRSGQIAKEIVNLAKTYNAFISIENIKNLKCKFNKEANRKINKIPYDKFKRFLKSNCEMLGVPIHEVDSYHTSKWCSRCGALNNGHHPGNYALYRCKCGLVVNSDRKASLAIAVKSVLERNRTHELIDVVQISKTRVPVNGLLRFDDADTKVAVQNNYQPTESHLSC